MCINVFQSAIYSHGSMYYTDYWLETYMRLFNDIYVSRTLYEYEICFVY